MFISADNPTPDSESQLAGDYQAILADNVPALLNYAEKLAGRDAAQDLLQETFLKIHRNPDRLLSARVPLAYLTAVLKNVHLDTLRKAKAEARAIDGYVAAAAAGMDEKELEETTGGVERLLDKRLVPLFPRRVGEFATAVLELDCDWDQVRRRLSLSKAMLRRYRQELKRHIMRAYGKEHWISWCDAMKKYVDLTSFVRFLRWARTQLAREELLAFDQWMAGGGGQLPSRIVELRNQRLDRRDEARDRLLKASKTDGQLAASVALIGLMMMELRRLMMKRGAEREAFGRDIREATDDFLDVMRAAMETDKIPESTLKALSHDD